MEATNGKVKLAALDVDESPEIAAELRVSSIPAVFAFQGGQIIGKFVGDIGDAGVAKFLADMTSKASNNSSTNSSSSSSSSAANATSTATVAT